MPVKKKTGIGKTIDFKTLVKEMNPFSKDSYLLNESPYSKIENYIGLGNYLLNAQVSGDIFKGIPEGRITALAGLSGVGKSYLSLNIAKEAQKQGYDIIWIDSENAIDDDLIERFGINPDTFNLHQMNTVNDVAILVKNLTEFLLKQRDEGFTIPKILLVIDSLGNLTSEKESKDIKDGNNTVDFTRPKEIRKFFRTNTQDLGKLKIPVIITNHVYAKTDFLGGTVMGGGEGLIFNASTILELSKAKLTDSPTKTDEDGVKKVYAPQTGIVVTSKIKKSRMTKSGIDIKFHISYYNGMNPFIGLQDYISWETCGIQRGKIEKGVFIAEDTAKSYAVKHLGKHVSLKSLFSPKVFTMEVLQKLQPVIKKVFEFPNAADEFYDIDSIIKPNEEDEGDE